MPAGKTYEPIATTTTTNSSTLTVTFSSIPQTYTDLVLVLGNANSVANNDDLFCRFNSDSGGNYSDTDVYGNGTSALSAQHSNYTGGKLIYITQTGNSNVITHIMNYSNTTTYKTMLVRDNNASNAVAERIIVWRNTAAISTIALSIPTSTAFASGCTFTLYGIAAA